MDRKAFFAALRRRSSGVFGTSLSQAQVEGTEALLDSCARNRVRDPHHVAHILAHVYKETGRYMMPIKETVYPYHKDKNPSDATVIARLDRAWAKGQLTWVSTPYWRDGAFGRGPIQTTHWRNYRKMGKRLGIDLVKHPERLLEPRIGADSAVIGMVEGLYTGKKLSDYSFPAALDKPPKSHPRRIVNGVDGTDREISRYHRAFHAAINAAGGVPEQSTSRDEQPEQPPTQEQITDMLVRELDQDLNGPDQEEPNENPYPKIKVFGALAVAAAAAVGAGWDWLSKIFGGLIP